MAPVAGPRGNKPTRRVGTHLRLGEPLGLLVLLDHAHHTAVGDLRKRERESRGQPWSETRKSQSMTREAGRVARACRDADARLGTRAATSPTADDPPRHARGQERRVCDSPSRPRPLRSIEVIAGRQPRREGRASRASLSENVATSCDAGIARGCTHLAHPGTREATVAGGRHLGRDAELRDGGHRVSVKMRVEERRASV